MRRLLLAVGFLLLLVATPARAATTYDVGMTSGGFRNGVCPSPAGNNIQTIRVGDTVRWTNCDDADHDMHWDTPGFTDPPPVHTGESIQQTFTKAGFYDYSDGSGAGRVIVQPSAGASTTKPSAFPATTTTAPSFGTAPTTTAASATTASLGNVFQTTTTAALTEDTTTTSEPDTTPITNKDSGANGALVAVTLAGIAAVVGGGVYVIRRMRSGRAS
jgi:hypothetical protein